MTHQVSVVKPNVPPTAAFTTTCDFLDCDFDATASTDSDGTVDDYAWDFGDGQTGTGSNAEPRLRGPGHLRRSRLVVTDNEDATDDVTSTQVVLGAPAASTVSYVGGAVNQGNVATPNVTTPTTVSAGDRLVLVLSRQRQQPGDVRPDRHHRLDRARHHHVGQHADAGSTPRSRRRPTRTRGSPCRSTRRPSTR